MMLLVEAKKRIGPLTYRGLCIIALFASMALAAYFMGKYLHGMILITAPEDSPLLNNLGGIWAKFAEETEPEYWKPMDYIVMIGSSVSGLEIFVCLITLCPLLSDLRYGFWCYFVYVPIYILFLIALTVTTSMYYETVDIEITVMLGISIVFYGGFEFLFYKWYKELESISKRMKELRGEDKTVVEEILPSGQEEEGEEKRPSSAFSPRGGSAFSARTASATSARTPSATSARAPSAASVRATSASSVRVASASGSRPASAFSARAISAMSTRLASAFSSKAP